MANKHRLDAYPPAFWNIIDVLSKTSELITRELPFNKAVSIRQRWYSFRKALTTEASHVAEYANMSDNSAGTELKAKIQRARTQRENWTRAGYPWPLASFASRLGAQMLDVQTGTVVNTNVLFRPETVKLRFFDTCIDVGTFEEDAAFAAAAAAMTAQAKTQAANLPDPTKSSEANTQQIATPFPNKNSYYNDDDSDGIYRRVLKLDQTDEPNKLDPEHEKEWIRQYEQRQLEKSIKDTFGSKEEKDQQKDPKK